MRPIIVVREAVQCFARLIKGGGRARVRSVEAVLYCTAHKHRNIARNPKSAHR
jgi:hypothetical protein